MPYYLRFQDHQVCPRLPVRRGLRGHAGGAHGPTAHADKDIFATQATGMAAPSGWGGHLVGSHDALDGPLVMPSKAAEAEEAA